MSNFKAPNPFPFQFANGRLVIDERCTCGHNRSGHGPRFGWGHGACGKHACRCPQFTWALVVDALTRTRGLQDQTRELRIHVQKLRSAFIDSKARGFAPADLTSLKNCCDFLSEAENLLACAADELGPDDVRTVGPINPEPEPDPICLTPGCEYTAHRDGRCRLHLPDEDEDWISR